MTGTTHALAGAAVGALVKRPVWAVIAGVLSHAALDFIPHRDYNRASGLLPDIAGSLAVLAVCAQSGKSEAVAGAIGGLLPDLENVAARRNSGKRKLFPSHWFRHEDRAVPYANIIEILTAATALAVLATTFRGPNRRSAQ